MSVTTLETSQHNAREVAYQEYKNARKELSEVIRDYWIACPEHQERFRAAQERVTLAGDRYRALL